MKKKLVIILDIVFVVVLAVVIYRWLVFDSFEAEKVEMEETVTLEETEEKQKPQAFPVTTEAASQPAVTARKICMIGDSRFSGMRDAVGYDPDITWIARDGMGHGWYWDNRSEVENLDRDTVIVYELGVNSLNAQSAIEAAEDIKSLGFTDIYMLTITGVNEEKEHHHGYHVTSEQIADYNTYLKNNLPYGVRCMDTFEMLSDDFTTMDGLHYDNDTYRRLYEMIVDEVERN